MENKKNWIITAGVMGFLGVAIGAFGAHSLKDVLTEQTIKTFQTGVLYHLVHSAVLLALALSNYKFKNSLIFITTGIILFSFSLYIYSITGIKFLAIVTPFGGVSFLLGWLFVILEALKGKNTTLLP
ncbi:MAG TPA: DUF423 domain-containing protein [Ignavibacteriaceae bacterium]|nr:DUF423 domain-containing protein [Ignavibacteriaceae bacterium]